MKLAKTKNFIIKVLKFFNYRVVNGEITKLTFSRPMLQAVYEKFGDKPLVGIEVGVWRGHTSEKIMKNLNMERLHLVDPWKEMKGSKVTQKQFDYAFKEVLNRWRYNPYINILIMDSITALNKIRGNVNFVYLDSDHEYPNTLHEIEGYWKLIRKGGILGGDDINNRNNPNGVFRAVSEFAVKNNLKVNIQDNDWWIEK